MNTNAGAAKPVAPNLDQSDQGLGVGRGEGGESGGWCQVSNRPLFKTRTIEIIPKISTKYPTETDSTQVLLQEERSLDHLGRMMREMFLKTD